jgi:hypothetical protein
MRETQGHSLVSVYRRTYAPYIARACDSLGDKLFEQLWQEGRTLSLEQALAEAEAEGLTKPQAATAVQSTRSPQIPAGLTPR